MEVVARDITRYYKGHAIAFTDNYVVIKLSKEVIRAKYEDVRIFEWSKMEEKSEKQIFDEMPDVNVFAGNGVRYYKFEELSSRVRMSDEVCIAFLEDNELVMKSITFRELYSMNRNGIKIMDVETAYRLLNHINGIDILKALFEK